MSVKHLGTYSEDMEVKYGVPQDTAFIYINGLFAIKSKQDKII